jgi:hypothetical protein
LTAAGGPGGHSAAADRPSVAQQLGIGCVTAVGGFFSGGMIAVLIAKVVGSIRGCEPPAGTPACDWSNYWAVGLIVGLITLPTLSLWKLRRSHRAVARHSERGGARGTD